MEAGHAIERTRRGISSDRIPTGTTTSLGRRDSQVKSRGYRIELGEIETALFAHPSVTECAVIAIPDELITNRVKAFVTVRDPYSEGELVQFCADRIPRYMIPEEFERRVTLPKTSTGKIDRRALLTESLSYEEERK